MPHPTLFLHFTYFLALAASFSLIFLCVSLDEEMLVEYLFTKFEDKVALLCLFVMYGCWFVAVGSRA